MVVHISTLRSLYPRKTDAGVRRTEASDGSGAGLDAARIKKKAPLQYVHFD
jgi:hypothetical protein